jgi:Carbamoyl-phosphate synthase L chain, ATP binding domain
MDPGRVHFDMNDGAIIGSRPFRQQTDPCRIWKETAWASNLAASHAVERRMALDRPATIAVYYEHPAWFERLFAELEGRGLPYERVLATEHVLDPGRPAENLLVFNRMSASAYTRDHGDAIAYSLDVLTDLELRGIPVINGSRAYGFEISKARQLSLLASLGLQFPATRVIHRADQAAEAARDLRFPIVFKPNIGGRGAGVVRFDDLAMLAEVAASGGMDLGPDGVALLQEYVPKRDGKITRVEVLDGTYLYAIDVTTSTETFDLCPADICRVPVAVGDVCLTAPAPTVTATKAEPPPEAIADAERIMRAAGIDIGGVEFLVDERDGRRLFYDINALSNFVANPVETLGFDPWERLGDYLETRARGGVPVQA